MTNGDLTIINKDSKSPPFVNDVLVPAYNKYISHPVPDGTMSQLEERMEIDEHGLAGKLAKDKKHLTTQILLIEFQLSRPMKKLKESMTRRSH